MNSFSRFNSALEAAGFSGRAELHLIPETGSNRRFYRIREGDRSAILIEGEPGNRELEQHVEIGRFLREIGAGVPEIRCYDSEVNVVVEEDLGDLTLQNYIRETGDFTVYEQVIDALVLMQVKGGKSISHCPYLKERVFDYETFRWETWYFVRYFLEAYCGAKIDNQRAVEHEFHVLARRLSGEPTYFMHRDFQSQNILVKNGKVGIVDFQGAYQGPLVYDLASLLKDPYVTMDVEIRNRLVDRYLTCLGDRWGIELDPREFRQVFLYAGLQRNMQALGAFAYLTIVKQRAQFFQYIPQAVDYLVGGLEEAGEFPELHKTVKWLNR
jgi:aminoglycoside/choline kinase family phosphotransferase